MTQPPKISPLAVVSAGIAMVRTVNSPRGFASPLLVSDIAPSLADASVMPCPVADGNA
jgi:hypothetical protein